MEYLIYYLIMNSPYFITLGIGMELYSIFTLYRLKKGKIKRELIKDYNLSIQSTIILAFIFQSLAILIQNYLGMNTRAYFLDGHRLQEMMPIKIDFGLIVNLIIGITIAWVIIDKDETLSMIRNRIKLRRKPHKNK